MDFLPAVVRAEYRGEYRIHVTFDHGSAIDFRGRLKGSIFEPLQDINGQVRFANVPAAVWRFELGGYPTVKKWLGYRQANAARLEQKAAAPKDRRCVVR
jgi:hypothetical protein